MAFLVSFRMSGAGDGGQAGDRDIRGAAVFAGIAGLFSTFIQFMLSLIWAIGMSVTRYTGQVGD
ncbi:hypothetical protein [Algoriphagus sp.]|uniref:hypothetical protein n=1 Tax=Algoriphagus sp. TaxID=1872435 RepID=UPI00391CD250